MFSPSCAWIVPSHNNPLLLSKYVWWVLTFQASHYILRKQLLAVPSRFITSLLLYNFSSKWFYFPIPTHRIMRSSASPSTKHSYISCRSLYTLSCSDLGWLHEVYIPLDPIFILTQIISSLSFVKPKTCRDAIFKVVCPTLHVNIKKKHRFWQCSCGNLWICNSFFPQHYINNPLHVRISIDSCPI